MDNKLVNVIKLRAEKQTYQVEVGGINQVYIAYERHIESACTCMKLDCPNSYFNGNDYSCVNVLTMVSTGKNGMNPK